jgi:hypothetical protein
LLGKDSEASKYTTAITEYTCLRGNNWKQQQKNGIFYAVIAVVL